MHHTWRDALREQQALKRDAHLWRSRSTLASPQSALIEVGGRQLLNFASNDYLGLANHPRLIQASAAASEVWGVGAGASHLISGHQEVHEELEQVLADFVGAERALLFSTGYMANLAVCSALVEKGDLILQDKLNHASLIDGAALSRARNRRYAHLDITHAERILATEAFEKSLLITDGVFSMDGDIAPLVELKQLADSNNGVLLVDDAHGFGVLGERGTGSLSAVGLQPRDNVLLMGTLGKACGSFGAFVAGDQLFIEQLIQSARTYIYTTALPPAVAAVSTEAIRLIQENENALSSILRERIAHFRALTQEYEVIVSDSHTPIQTVIVGCESAALAWSKSLLERGFYVPAIRPPTVPKGSARLRLTLSAAHTSTQLNQLIESLAEVQSEMINV